MLGITRCKELWTFLCFAPFVFLGSIATTSLRISWFHITREYSEDVSKFCIYWKIVHPSTAKPNMPHYEWRYNPTKDTVSKESSRFIHELLIQDPTFFYFPRYLEPNFHESNYESRRIVRKTFRRHQLPEWAGRSIGFYLQEAEKNSPLRCNCSLITSRP